MPLENANLAIPISEAFHPGERLLHLRLFRELWEIYPQVSPKLKKRGSLSRFKFALRGAFHGAPMEAWLDYLRRPEMRDLATRQPLLYLRLQWPYISRSFPPAERLQLLQNHYNLVFQRFSPGLRAALFSHDSLSLAKWEVPSLGKFSLSLQHLHDFGPEGEMILSLDHEEASRKIAFLHFSLSLAPDSPPALYIGCLQGGKADAAFNTRLLTAKFTQLTHGSRPKNLLVFALRRLARHWSVRRIRAVSTQLHVYRSHLKVDYDPFWKEVGGVQQPDGLFDLPLLSSSLADLSGIKPKRRPVYRRRCQLWDELGDQIDGTLQETSAKVGFSRGPLGDL